MRDSVTKSADQGIGHHHPTDCCVWQGLCNVTAVSDLKAIYFQHMDPERVEMLAVVAVRGISVNGLEAK
jgi:hypothetical protein